MLRASYTQQQVIECLRNGDDLIGCRLEYVRYGGR